MLTSRKVRLLRILTSETDWISSSELANRLGCSNKTILTELHHLSSELPDGWELQSQRGKGVYLKRPCNGLNRDLDYVVLKQDDSMKLLMLLLEHPQGLTIQDLADAMYQSVTTINRSLSSIEKHLQSYQLVLKRRPVRISGKERFIRKLIFDLSLYSGHPPFWESKHNDQLRVMIRETESYFQMHYSEQTTKLLISAIDIWLYRISQHCYFQMDSKMRAVYEGAKDVLSALRSIYRPVESLFGVNIPEHEYLYLIMVLLSVQKKGDYPVRMYQLFDIHVSKEAVQRFVEYVEHKFEITLRTDKLFIDNLLQYLKEASFRWTTQIHIHRNLYLQEIKAMYPKVFRAVRSYLMNHFPYYHAVMDDDIADIVIQITGSLEAQKSASSLKLALIVPTCDYSTRYFESKLSTHMEVPVTINCYDELDMKHHTFNSYDIVITTDQQWNEEFGYTYMNPLLFDHDMDRINEEARRAWHKKISSFNLPEA